MTNLVKITTKSVSSLSKIIYKTGKGITWQNKVYTTLYMVFGCSLIKIILLKKRIDIRKFLVEKYMSYKNLYIGEDCQ